MANFSSILQRVLAEFDEQFRREKGDQMGQGIVYEDAHIIRAWIKSALTESLKEAFAVEKENEKKIIGEHNARILNEFQLQGTPNMPFIAYDERVCLLPAMEKATKETFKNIETEYENNKS